MGTWDAGPFDNDSAADFANGLDDVQEQQRVAVIRAALMAAVENDGYLDLDEGAPAVAAAALVACRLPGGGQFAPNGYGPEAPVPDLPPDLVPLAISAVERVLGEDSELATLWSEDIRAQRPWHTSMQQLKSVLLSGTTDGMNPLFSGDPMIPTPFRGTWCATDLGDHRPCRYTYEHYPIESVPPLDEKSFTGDFAWRGGLGDVLEEQTAAMDGLAADLAKAGLNLPIDFVTYMTRSNLYRCLDEVSGTCCWTSLSMPLPSPIEPDARMVRFFRDQQDCVQWYLYLRPDGDSFIVHSYRDLEGEAEVRSGGDADEIENLPDFDNDPDYEIFWCAPTAEIFAYRFWTESVLTLALNGERPIEDLDEAQLAYLHHYTQTPTGGR